MIYSMTGFGRSTGKFGNKSYVVEMKSLNSRYFDPNLRIPQLYRQKELGLRKLLSELLHRGKIDMSLSVEYAEEGAEYKLNQAAIRQYFKEITELSSSIELGQSDVLSTIMRLPNVTLSNDELSSEEEWEALELLIIQAAEKLKGFRLAEGEELYRDLESRINLILNLLNKIKQMDPIRMEEARKRLRSSFQDAGLSDHVDQNRFEQEIIYYLEKMDITEELTRLSSHCRYFMEVLHDTDALKGKKLGFISQELGREINTIGSKSSDAEIQRLVVMMKDELEKIKEQLLNIL